jgi:hypothetical protein
VSRVLRFIARNISASAARVDIARLLQCARRAMCARIRASILLGDNAPPLRGRGLRPRILHSGAAVSFVAAQRAK